MDLFWKASIKEDLVPGNIVSLALFTRWFLPPCTTTIRSVYSSRTTFLNDYSGWTRAGLQMAVGVFIRQLNPDHQLWVNYWITSVTEEWCNACKRTSLMSCQIPGGPSGGPGESEGGSSESPPTCRIETVDLRSCLTEARNSQNSHVCAACHRATRPETETLQFVFHVNHRLPPKKCPQKNKTLKWMLFYPANLWQINPEASSRRSSNGDSLSLSPSTGGICI